MSISLPRMKKLWWYPYAGNFAPMSAFAEIVHAPSIGRRLAAALRTLPMLGKPRR